MVAVATESRYRVQHIDFMSFNEWQADKSMDGGRCYNWDLTWSLSNWPKKSRAVLVGQDE